MGNRKNWLVWMAKIAGRLVFSPFFRLEIEGTEKIPKHRAFVLLPKHQRWEDIPLIGIATPRPLYYVAKFELFRNPISRCVLKSLGAIPLNRQKPMESRESLNMVLHLLEKQEGVVIFPEGTYYRDRMGPGYAGMVRLILSRSSPPFIPVGVNYIRKGFQTLVRVKFGNAFFAGPDISASNFLDQMMKEIADLSGLEPYE